VSADPAQGARPASEVEDTPAAPVAEPADEPVATEPRPPVDVGDWSEVDLTAVDPPCARLGPASDGRQLCRVVTRAGTALDEMTTDESGVFELREGKSVRETIAYDRVFSEGAAGSLYETFFDGAEPVLLLRSCMITDDTPLSAGWEGYAPCGVRRPPER